MLFIIVLSSFLYLLVRGTIATSICYLHVKVIEPKVGKLLGSFITFLLFSGTSMALGLAYGLVVFRNDAVQILLNNLFGWITVVLLFVSVYSSYKLLWRRPNTLAMSSISVVLSTACVFIANHIEVKDVISDKSWAIQLVAENSALAAWFCFAILTIKRAQSSNQSSNDADSVTMIPSNIYQDTEQPIYKPFITFLAQWTLFVAYTQGIRAYVKKFSTIVTSESNDDEYYTYYILGVLVELSYILKHDPFKDVYNGAIFWGQKIYFESLSEDRNWIRMMSLILRIFADAVVNVSMLCYILVILPYQSSHTDDALTYVFNLVAVFYIIEIDDFVLPGSTKSKKGKAFNGHRTNAKLLERKSTRTTIRTTDGEIEQDTAFEDIAELKQIVTRLESEMRERYQSKSHRMNSREQGDLESCDRLSNESCDEWVDDTLIRASFAEC